jgi:DNA polymerase III subunit delta
MVGHRVYCAQPMKLSSRDALRFVAKPDPAIAGALLYGSDPTRVSQRRKALIDALIGPAGAGEMRLARLAGGDLRRDPAGLLDAVKAVGFFPGPRAVLVDEAGDGNAEAVRVALADWRAGDATIVVSAGALTARSPLRKAFEGAPNAVAIGIYADQMRRGEIEAALAKEALGRLAPEAMGDLEALAQSVNPGDFEQFLVKLGLYKRGDATPLTSEDISACAPAAAEAEIDALIDMVADGRADRLPGAFAALGPRTGLPTGLTIAAARHFRTLYAASVHPEGPEAALGRARPPVFGPRRSRMAAQVRAFGTERLEQALRLIQEADLRLRSGRPTPGPALAERLFVRLARMARR